MGPLEVDDGDRALPLGGVKQRSVLALLLLHAPEPVSADRLIDELWGEQTPATADKALQQHVFRLRKLLEPHEVLLTRPSGYVADVPQGALDLDEFERLRDEGRRALDDRRPADAADSLRRALALWRGPPLAGLEHERFAGDAVARLEEARIETTELRIDADLALGRHAELVGELQSLIGAHPLREGLRRQLMLALYGSGRQADALAAYADARTTLVQELGIEPGPELRQLQQAILDQDPALGVAKRPAPAPRRRRRRIAAGAGAVLVGAALAAVLLASRDDRTPAATATEQATATGGELAAIDAATGKVGRRIAAGRTPVAVAAADGRLWVVDGDAGTLLAVDTSSGAVETLATGATPIDVEAGRDAVWVANGRPPEGVQFFGAVATELVALDPHMRTRRQRIGLPDAAEGKITGAVEQSIALSHGAVWGLTADGSILRVSLGADPTTASKSNIGAIAVAAGGAGVWALRRDGRVIGLDERTARVRRRVKLPTDAPTSLAVGDNAAWVTSSVDGTLWRIAPDGKVGAVDVGSGATEIAAGSGRAWVANPTEGTVTAVDPVSMRVVRSVKVGGMPRAVALDGDTVWVATAGATAPVGHKVAGVAPLPASICEPVQVGRKSRADVLLVSDLPLQGGLRISATQMAQAITFVLREHGFRAGRFRVAYQSCDDSIGRSSSFDPPKCTANARAYGKAESVVAVIGTLNSPCSIAALPQLNRAPGPPAMISPLNSFVGLTRAAPGVDERLLADLYPTGRRNFLRVFPTDDLQGAALALLARDRGRERVFALDDGDPAWGALLATGFTIAARRLGLDVAGRKTWNPDAKSYAALADRVAAARPDAVFVGGILDNNAAAVVRELRRRLGPGVDLLGGDGLTPLSVFVAEAGPAARGVFVSLAGTLTERMPPAGTAFVRRFARTQAGAEVQPSAVYTAQATEVVLAALARSEGTRASVLRELFRTRVRNGLLGDFGFDANGDITEAPVTIMRVARGGSSTRILSVDGGVVERVVRPSADLVAKRG